MRAALVVACLLLACSCQSQGKPAASLTVTSSAFAANGPIPRKHTCDGKDVSPALAWTGLPAATKSVVVLCEDPDAPGGVFVHWVVFNVSGSGVAEGDARAGVQGLNDFDSVGWNGPCPPPGKPHHYHFRVYALDATLPLAKGATRHQVLTAMKGHVLAEGDLVGTYGR